MLIHNIQLVPKLSIDLNMNKSQAMYSKNVNYRVCKLQYSMNYHTNTYIILSFMDIYIYIYNNMDI